MGDGPRFGASAALVVFGGITAVSLRVISIGADFLTKMDTSRNVVATAGEAVAAGGDDHALLHNMTATLGAICALLSVFSAIGMVAHSTYIMCQMMVFQAVTAPGLVLCGALLYGSSAILATGAIICGMATLVCSYFVRLQRNNEQVLQELCEDELVAEWSDPSPSVQAAARIVQCCFRSHLAVTRMTRAREFDAWLSKCRTRRLLLHGVVIGTILLTTLFLVYTNMIFAVVFDSSTCKGWITTCVVALVVEATLQQPVVLLMTGVLGDFVVESADFLLELLGN